jgi:hypothetical protein
LGQNPGRIGVHSFSTCYFGFPAAAITPGHYGSSFAELMWVKSGQQKPDEKRHASMCHAIQPVVGIRGIQSECMNPKFTKHFSGARRG